MYYEYHTIDHTIDHTDSQLIKEFKGKLKN